MKKIKGFKAFNADLTCHNFKFKVGKTFKHDGGKVKLCKEGFHFCKQIQHVFSYYGFNKSNRVCEIEASGDVFHGDNKSVCSTIKIVRELSWDEVLTLANFGSNNLGYSNAGNDNAGNGNAGEGNAGSYNAGNGNAGSCNVGNGNVGSYNAGSYNAGNGNAGNGNAGNRNAGNSNAGNRNAGNGNAGNDNAGNGNVGHGNAGNGNVGHGNAGNGNAGSYNAGSYNAGSCNVGLFNSKQRKVRLFNRETTVPWNDDRIQTIMRYSPNFQEYVHFSSMTDEEKTDHPYAKTTGGYYRQLGYKEGWIRFWGNAQESVKQAFLSLPNFDAEVFEEITGIKVRG